MADHYEDYTREQLMRLLRERDKRPRFGPCEVKHAPASPSILVPPSVVCFALNLGVLALAARMLIDIGTK